MRAYDYSINMDDKNKSHQTSYLVKKNGRVEIKPQMFRLGIF